MQHQNSDLWAITREALAERIHLETGMKDEGLGVVPDGTPTPEEIRDAAIKPGRVMVIGGDREDRYTLDRGVAIIDIAGVFVNRDPWFGDVTYGWAAKSVLDAANDPAATAILLKIDSPGGMVSGVTQFVDAVRAANKLKPVYIHTDGILASGAYWPSSGAHMIAASRTSQVGSIGVVTAHTDLSRMLDRVGVKISFITSGKYKAMGNFAEPLNDDAKAYIQSRIDSVYAMFAGDVAEGRKLSIETVDTWADGKVFPAAAAMEVGLIDRVESLDAFLKFIRGENKMKVEDFKANHPETFQKVYDMGVTAANAEARGVRDAAVAAAEKKAHDAAAGMVAVLFGDAAKAKFDAMTGAGVTADQIKAFQTAGLFGGAGDPQAQNPDADSRRQILEGIQAAANPPVAPGAKRNDGDDFEAKVSAYMEAKGVSKAQAMRIVGMQYPKLRDKWLADRNKR